jgi:hypothetical protein
MPEVVSRMVDMLGMDMSIGTPADFRKYGESEYNKALHFVKAIKP